MSRPPRLLRRFWPLAPLVALPCLVLALPADEPGADKTPVATAKAALEPIAPVLPAEIVGALQEGRYADAAKAIDAYAKDPKRTEDETSYASLVGGIARRLAGQNDEARATLTAAIEAHPNGIWVHKLRSELAVVQLATGHPAEAEALARTEAEALLTATRKDRLAAVYRQFAQRLLKPSDPITPPDPNGAYALLAQAEELAKSAQFRATLRYEKGLAAQQAGNHAQALADFQAYLSDFPEGSDRGEVRFHLGESQLALGQPLPARLTWTDLARDLEDPAPPLAADPKLRARTLFQIARTYGIPSPPDDSQLNLGVATLRRFLEAYPGDPLAVKAAYEIGEAFLARGKSQQAIEALNAFLSEKGFEATTDEARRDLAELRMKATFQVAQILQGQGKFDEAITAWQGYLTKFPNGPQSADAQRSILDTRLLIAEDHERRDRHDRARSAWQEFAVANPLDPRVPEVLFRIGQSWKNEKKYDEAIAAWEALAAKFPGTEPAAHAQFEIAAIYETVKGEPAEAIERFKKVNVSPWQEQAAQRIHVMESKALTVITPRAFRSGETPQLKIATRNIENLTFTAYRLNAEAYFRKKHNVAGVESLDISLVQPDSEWTVPVEKYAKLKPVETTYDLKIKTPGVFVVKVTDEKSLQATTLVLGSDLDAIVKASREQLLVYAQDMKTGKVRPNTRVLVAEGDQIVLDEKTGDDGVLLRSWDKPRDPNAHLSYLLLDGPDVAGSGLGIPEKVSQGLTARAYLYTDRPAYRPGQLVSLRGVVREVVDGQYLAPAGQTYRLEVTDSRGRAFLARPVTLSAFGTFHETVELESAAPVGMYRMRVFQPGKSDFSGNFEVQAYQLEKVDLAFDFPRMVYYRGEKIEGKVVAKYQYGTPLASRPIQVNLPDGRILSGTTDADGTYKFEVPTEGFAEEQTLSFVAQLPQDNVAVAANIMVAVRAFRIDLNTTRDVYLDGEPFTVSATTLDAQGKPVGETLRLSVLKRVERNGNVTENEVQSVGFKTDPKTGQGTAAITVEDKDGGLYTLRVAGTDRFGNPVVADRMVTVSGEKDETKLRILADTQRFRVGDTATLRIHNRGKPGPALVTWEGDRILQYKQVTLKEGENDLSWKVDGAQFPNFTLTASRMVETRFDDARIDLKIERDLSVTIKAVKESVGPGDPVEVEVTTVDQLGNPVAAEVSVALIDQALLRLHGDPLPPIDTYFYNQARTGAFSTESTNTFRYEPATIPVPEAVVEEAAVAAAQLASNAVRLGVVEQAQAGVVLDSAVAAPAPAEGPLPPGGGLGGLAAGRPQAEAKAERFMDGDLLQESAGGVAPLNEPGDSAAARKSGAAANGHGLFAGEPGMEGDKRDQWAKDASKFAFGSKRSRRMAENGGGDEPQSRESFVETAYWNPSVLTDKTGKARVKFDAPMALSRYQFTARGTTGSDTLVGQTTGELVVKKDFFVDLKRPATFTQGDKPRLMASVHHAGVMGPITVTLKVYAGETELTFPKMLDVKADGVDEILFDPFEVPEADVVRLTIDAAAGNSTDSTVNEIPVKPWGVQAIASASGTSTDSTAAFVELPKGREYENPEMVVVLSPSVRRMIVELALEENRILFSSKVDVGRCFPIPPNTVADRASSLLAAVSAWKYLTAIKVTDSPEASRLSDRIRSLVSELVTLQNDDGGWPWVAPDEGQQRPSERLTSARAAWAVALAEPLGFLPDPAALQRSDTFLTQEFAKTDPADHETRAAMLHALSVRKQASFEAANALNRSRQGLSDVALSYLALTFVNLERKPLAVEVLGVLGPRAKTESVAPGVKPRVYWSGEGKNPAARGEVEATALAALAYAEALPNDPNLDGAAEWLLAHRVGLGWNPSKAKGPALAALGKYYGASEAADDRYELTVTVNDTEIFKGQILGSAEGKALAVPLKAIKLAGRNDVKFTMNGRGRFGYTATLTGFTRDFKPDQDTHNRPFQITGRDYLAVERELDGKPLPIGFGAAINPQYFENKVTQTPLGGRTRVRINLWRDYPVGQPSWERDFLMLEEYLPAGTTLIEGTVQANGAHVTREGGKLTFYFDPDQMPGSISYDVFGYLPGKYRALPAELKSVYDPTRHHLSKEGSLDVLAPGEASTDPYKPTPDELYARGKALYDAGKLAESADPLEALWTGYTLRDDIAKDAARMLLFVHIAKYDPRKVVQYFEILKEKSPELVIPFDKILVVGRAYRDINEFERAYLVWRAVAEASYLEDARVGEVLRQRGKPLEGVAFLLGLWREYPNTASIESDFFGLSQVLVDLASKATTDPTLRSALAEADATRSKLLLQSIRVTQTFLGLSPKNPVADEASLALVGAFLELEDFEAVVKLSERYAKIYPKSNFLDSFQYSEALGRFYLGQYDRAIEVAETIAKATYKDANGIDQPSPNKWQAVYILGQIYDARRKPAQAVAYYERVADRFTDAAEAVEQLTRKDLKLPEVSVIHPPLPPAVAGGGVGLRNIAADSPRNEKNEVQLEYRNIAEADVKVYPVDLMRLYLTRRNLDGIAGIDLAGITPLHETKIPLGDGKDFDDKIKTLNLPLEKEGAYLVMVRGDNLYASGIVLLSPLELEVLEEPGAGRVRVTVRDAATKAPAAKVQVKVIGSENPAFFSGQTDLRGVFTAEGVRGQVTAVSRQGTGRYAFYRGTTYVGAPPVPPAPTDATQPDASAPADAPSLEGNLRQLNSSNNLKQLQRLEQRYNAPPSQGVEVQKAY